MKPYLAPESLKVRNATSAPTAEVLKVGGLLPGLRDIPYVRGEFLLEGPLEKKGPVVTKVVPACATFWEPSEQERAAIAGGGLIQTLTFAPKPPVQQVDAAFFGAIPESPVIEGIARLLFQRVTGDLWDGAGKAAQANWVDLAKEAYKVFLFWKADEA